MIHTGYMKRNGQTQIAETRTAKAKENPNFTTGQAAISMIFLVGGTILLIGVTLAFLIFSFITSAFGFKAANQALGIALGGANDALLRMSANSNYPLLGCEQYDVAIDDHLARVRTQRSWGDPLSAPAGSDCPVFKSPPVQGLATIESEATVFGRIRKVNMIVSISPDGQINVVSVKQEIISTVGAGSGE